MRRQAQDASQGLTRTCQPLGEVVSARLVAALEAVWAAIRARHEDVPAVVIVMGPGTGAGRPAVWGHFAALRWQHGTDRLPEVLISGEGLSRSPVEVLGTLLHEAAHALADVRKIQDTSRQGRWHNKKFAALANEVGLEVEKADKIGWSRTTVHDETRDAYARPLSALAAAMNMYRHPEHQQENKRVNSNNGLTCECSCPRKIRVAAQVYSLGPITCGVCCDNFTSPDGEVG